MHRLLRATGSHPTNANTKIQKSECIANLHRLDSTRRLILSRTTSNSISMSSAISGEMSGEELPGSSEYNRQCSMDNMNPPESRGEKMRDALLRLLDGRLFQFIGLLVLFLVILDGAFFFFLLMGWHTMCIPRTDCDVRNYWYNVSVQILTGLFTYSAVVAMPWRCVNAFHVSGWHCPYRQNSVGHDLYGFTSKDIWFHIPLRRRGGIIFVLILNCLAQFANQASRIMYSSFEEQNTSPGNIWTATFFLGSMVFAAIGGAWLVYEESHLRKASPPDTFPPGLLQVMRGLWLCRCKTVKEAPATTQDEGTLEEGIEDAGDHTPVKVGDVLVPEHEHVDPTRHHSLHDVTPASRGSMRLFGM